MWFLLFSLAIAQASAYVPINTKYHRTVGIPEAARIKAAEENISTRIVGGTETRLGDHPHFAGLLVALQTGQTSVCGATLLTHEKLITAAHCWDDGDYYALWLEVVLGSVTLFNGGTRIITDKVESHANFEPRYLHNDLAIITIPHIEFSDVIQPATLPSGFLLYLTFEHSNVYAVGFGKTSDSATITINQTARNTTLEVMPHIECQSLYGFNLIETQICTYGIYGRSTCGGDSGGPMTLAGMDRILVGVTSFNAASGCHSGYPSGFTRITSFVNWINNRL